MIKKVENKKIVEFCDLDAWKKAHNFSVEIYRLSKGFPKEETYGITSQLRRASVSISANIAEGFSRYHFNDKVNFYYNARGSASEAQSLLFLSKDLGYLKEEEFESVRRFCKDVSMLINGLIRSIEKQK